MNIFAGNNYPHKRNAPQTEYLVPPSIFSPSSSGLSNPMSSGVSPLTGQAQGHGFPPTTPTAYHNANPNLKKRVWVKRPNKTPTTLYIGVNDIVDDLKTQVMSKFSTSLAVQNDPSDLIIKMEIPLDTHSPPVIGFKHTSFGSDTSPGPPTSNSNKPKIRAGFPMNAFKDASTQSAPISPIPVPMSKSTLLLQNHSEDIHSNSSGVPLGADIISGPSPASAQVDSHPFNTQVIILEPDVSVWKILETYFPQGMKMTDAFIVEAPYQYNEQRNRPVQVVNKNGMHRNTAPPEYIIVDNNSDMSSPFSQNQTPSNPTHYLNRGSSFNLDQNNNYNFYNSLNKTAVIGEQKLPSPRDYAKFRRSTQKTPEPTANLSGTVLLLPKGQKPMGVTSSNSSVPYKSSRKISTNNDRFYSITEGAEDEPKVDAPNRPQAMATKSDPVQRKLSESGDTTIELPNKSTVSATAASTQNQKKKKSIVKDPSKTIISNILSNINVLVVEDNLVNQKIMSRYLTSCSVRYKIASTGKEALEMWREGGFHLVFMDIQLPVMSGMEVTQEIRRLERLNRIGNFAETPEQVEDIRNLDDVLDLSLFRSPIIIVALTASTSQADKQNALAAGCNDYLTKPVQLQWLRSKLNEWGCMQALVNYDHFKNTE